MIWFTDVYYFIKTRKIGNWAVSFRLASVNLSSLKL